jgi:hypothetical protein
MEQQRDIAEIAFGLREAFYWAAAPQGHDHWLRVYNNLADLAGIVRLSPSFSNRNVWSKDPNKVISVASGLVDGFLWKDTPQGFTYWNSVYIELELMSALLKRKLSIQG